MGNWKELGEVPDSDDEGIDSQQYPAPETANVTATAPDATLEAEDDIWSVPDSPRTDHTPEPLPNRVEVRLASTKANAQEFTTLPSSSPLTERSQTPDFGGDDLSGWHNEPETARGKSAWALSSSLGLNEIDELSMDLEPSHLAPLSHGLSARSPTQISALLPITNSTQLATPSTGQRILHPADDADPRQVALRAERSLRPRKPIQEHPYLLESAHYNKFMKSHGFKPVKVVLDTEKPRTIRKDEDVDKDFSVDESQDMSGANPLHGLDEGLLSQRDEQMEDADELALSPSLRSSSISRRLPVSSQQSGEDQTDNTSVLGEDEFPTLNELAHNPSRVKSSSSKRRNSLKSSSRSKRPRLLADVTEGTPLPAKFIRFDDWSPSPPPLHPENELLRLSEQEEVGANISPVPAVPSALKQKPFRSTLILSSSPLRPANSQVVDLTAQDVDSQSEEVEDLDSGTFSEASSDTDVVRQNGKRIRGVLPASWLRLDQKRAPTSTKKLIQRRSRSRSPEVLPRRGVAVPRFADPSTSSTPLFFLDNDDDDNNDDEFMDQREGTDEISDIRKEPEALIVDDGDSVAEEDHIDRMLLGTKRNSSLTKPKSVKRNGKKRQGTFNRGSGNTFRQPKINKVLPRVASASDSTAHKDPVARSRATRGSPPLLSILDLLDKEAPQFIKVAARTARRKPRKGKSSPSKKYINLGNRQDNVDALSVLRNWNAGKIRPKIPVPPPQRKRQPLQPLSTNPSRGPTRQTAFSNAHPRQISRQASLGKFISTPGDKISKPLHSSTAPPSFPRQNARNSANYDPFTRPAQLETDELASPDAARFSATKKALDAFYRQSWGRRHSHADVGLERYLGRQKSASESRISETGTARGNVDSGELQGAKPAPKSRFRKKSKPRHIHLDAAQFFHANDPLPPLSPAHINKLDCRHEEGKITGLGPYGTHYTQHFEILPLDHGIFFHESTLIGSGRLGKALSPAIVEKMLHSRKKVFFTLGEQSLSWGPWDEAISSELGILVDSLAEQLRLDNQANETGKDVIRIADFLLEYLLDSLSFPDETSEKAFVSRILEILQSVADQLESGDSQPAVMSLSQTKMHVQILERFLVVNSLALRVSRRSYSNFAQGLRLEELLKRLARASAKNLFAVGLDEVRTAYGELQALSCRERGIRCDKFVLSGWTTLIKVLGNAQVPRAGFWDTIYSVMNLPEVVSRLDAQDFERLWKDMITLLPLGEFDDSGLLIHDMRHTTPLEGWTLPQQVLKSVFTVYKQNPRQSPSFNEYCRSLISRCHYLIQQWDWYKCAGIIGTIFDFFGSQDLGNLRNEEVFQSARFLEELAANPSLAIEPEDRCFHIFIKTIAIAIRRLQELGLNKDIRNLIARTLPNHNRQHHKEQAIHQHDLAALRNHHDLLCTLFWASPAELRPGVHLLEKLVIPGSSHKEACLINLRAWNQLARFLVSSGEESNSFKRFMSWQNNIFSQTLDQYLSAASDIQQQFLALSKDASRDISQDLMNATIVQNRQAAMDVLYFCTKASLDVLKHAKSLPIASSCLNAYLLDQVFTRFDFTTRDFDWRILVYAVNTLEIYLGFIEKAVDAQYSSEADTTDSSETEDAVMFLEHRLVGSFCSMAREILSIPEGTVSSRPKERALCLEKVVLLSGKIAARFFHSGVSRLATYFTPGKYCIFPRAPPDLILPQRRYLPLFLSALVKENVFDYGDIRSTMLELWMLSVITPKQSGIHVDYLGNALKFHNLPYLPRLLMPLGTTSDYNNNRDLFESAVAYMRETLRSATGPKRQSTRLDYGKVLRSVMGQIKSDLKSLRSNPREHMAFVRFVREVVVMVKSYGADICPVDSFFYQVSQDYSPSVEDPQLHTAGIIGYGFRLGEGETTAIPRLFHYLYENFKIAVVNGRLDEERSIIEKSIGNRHILSFMVTRMLPVAFRATLDNDLAWPLLSVYCEALKRLLTCPEVPPDITADNPEYVVALVGHMLTWLTTLQSRSSLTSTMSLEQIYIMTQMVALLNALQSALSILACLSSPAAQCSSASAAMEIFTEFTEGAALYLDEIVHPLEEQYVFLGEVRAGRLLGGVAGSRGGETVALAAATGDGAAQVDSFSKHIISDIQKNWVVTADRVSINPRSAPGSTPGATQSGLQGSAYGPWEMAGLLRGLHEQVCRWNMAVIAGQKRGAERETRAGSSARSQALEAFGAVFV